MSLVATLICLVFALFLLGRLTEEAVRRYLIRKPMTTKDLLKKFQTKRTGLSSEQTVNVLAQILKRLNPERKNVNDKMHFYLTE
ncbi:IIF subunit 1 Transcription initiation factor [Collichthys lucidus]|uniref:Transcription initiation factor IIF subunit alpha n=1 Tax=Collichthys lucidus TaxID=240159 RepID=A0A4U5VT21_COLLU|nr:IIF subunit 1 Transcription initiation factor [Collichthys lucidus]